MPEGPEIASLSEQLSILLTDRTITEIKIKSGRYKRKENIGLTNFISCLPLTITRIWYIGKRIFWEFTNSETTEQRWLVNGLGMSGIWSVKQEKHSHIQFTLQKLTHDGETETKTPDDINEIWFTDVRCFGTLDFYDDEEKFTKVLEEYPGGFLGTKIITEENFSENLKKCKKKYLVTALMDQRAICSGVGNYLLSEIMYLCGFHPDIRCHELTSPQIHSLYITIDKIMKESYQEGGMTMRNYQQPDGKKGEYMSALRVYNKSHDPEGNKVVGIKGRHGRTLWVVKEQQRIKE